MSSSNPLFCMGLEMQECACSYVKRLSCLHTAYNFSAVYTTERIYKYIHTTYTYTYIKNLKYRTRNGQKWCTPVGVLIYSICTYTDQQITCRTIDASTAKKDTPLKTNMTGWKVNILQLEIHLKIWFLPFVMLGNSGVYCKYVW